MAESLNSDRRPEVEDCGCSESFFVFHDFLKVNDHVVSCLKNHGLIKGNYNCARCGEQCLLDTVRYVWRCQKLRSVHKKKAKRCNYSHNAFKGTWLERAKTKVADNLKFCQLFLDKSYSVHLIRREIGWAQQTVIDWASFAREVLENYLVNTVGKIGGPGLTVEIDESKFGRTKYYRGRFTRGQWVFGGYCRETGEFFAVPVARRDTDTLLAVIKDKIHEGTTIISDCWRAYNCLVLNGFRHLTVNHTYNFVDPETGAHTNNVERMWRSVKESFPYTGRKQRHFKGYLARFYFLRRFKTLKERMHVFFMAASNMYTPQ